LKRSLQMMGMGEMFASCPPVIGDVRQAMSGYKQMSSITLLRNRVGAGLAPALDRSS